MKNTGPKNMHTEITKQVENNEVLLKNNQIFLEDLEKAQIDNPNEDEELKISKKYTSKELLKMKILDIHTIAKSLDISILNDENKKKIKKNLVEEIVQTY